jgi:hypothetical protein
MPLPQWRRTLAAKLEGHYRYYGVSGNGRSISRYEHWTRKIIYKWVNRRSRKLSYSWEEFERYLDRRPLPKPRIVHNFYYASAVS